jgi:hypothetical protein
MVLLFPSRDAALAALREVRDTCGVDTARAALESVCARHFTDVQPRSYAALLRKCEQLLAEALV